MAKIRKKQIKRYDPTIPECNLRKSSLKAITRMGYKGLGRVSRNFDGLEPWVNIVQMKCENPGKVYRRINGRIVEA